MKYKQHNGFLDSPDTKRTYNRWLFGIVSPRYALVNRLLSFNRDTAWKKWLVTRLPSPPASRIIDLASGNGDIAFRLRKKYPGGIIIPVDLTPEMYAPVKQRGIKDRLRFVRQDMSWLGIKSNSVNILTGGYALRNAPDLEKTISEIRRVLAPGGCAAFLDFSKPRGTAIAFIEYLLLKLWGGFWGVVFHGKAEIYGYIAESLLRFPDRPSLHTLLYRHHLEVTASKRFFFGIIEVIICRAT